MCLAAARDVLGSHPSPSLKRGELRTCSRCKPALTTSASAGANGGLHCADAFLDHTEVDRLSVTKPASAFATLAVTHREIAAGEMKVDDM
jgi:hypothetical protein